MSLSRTTIPKCRAMKPPPWAAEQRQLTGIRAAAKALGHSAEPEVVGVKKRVLSAAGRAAIVKAMKKRLAKVRKQAKKAN